MVPQSFFQLKKDQCSINLLPATPFFIQPPACDCEPCIKKGIYYCKPSPSLLSLERRSIIFSLKNMRRFIKFATSEPAAKSLCYPCGTRGCAHPGAAAGGRRCSRSGPRADIAKSLGLGIWAPGAGSITQHVLQSGHCSGPRMAAGQSSFPAHPLMGCRDLGTSLGTGPTLASPGPRNRWVFTVLPG